MQITSLSICEGAHFVHFAVCKRPARVSRAIFSQKTMPVTLESVGDPPDEPPDETQFETQFETQNETQDEAPQAAEPPEVDTSLTEPPEEPEPVTPAPRRRGRPPKAKAQAQAQAPWLWAGAHGVSRQV